jgi:hypothetical protein
MPAEKTGIEGNLLCRDNQPNLEFRRISSGGMIALPSYWAIGRTEVLIDIRYSPRIEIDVRPSNLPPMLVGSIRVGI